MTPSTERLMGTTDPKDDVVLALAELDLLRSICGSPSAMEPPASVVDALHLDALLQSALVEAVLGGFTCTALGRRIAAMAPSQRFPQACLYRLSDILSVE